MQRVEIMSIGILNFAHSKAYKNPAYRYFKSACIQKSCLQVVLNHVYAFSYMNHDHRTTIFIQKSCLQVFQIFIFNYIKISCPQVLNKSCTWTSSSQVLNKSCTQTSCSQVLNIFSTQISCSQVFNNFLHLDIMFKSLKRVFCILYHIYKVQNQLRIESMSIGTSNRI